MIINNLIQCMSIEIISLVDLSKIWISVDFEFFDNFLLNSDMSNKPSDHLSVAKTIRELSRLGYKKSSIDKISHRNASDYFKI